MVEVVFVVCLGFASLPEMSTASIRIFGSPSNSFRSIPKRRCIGISDKLNIISNRKP